MTLNAGIDDIVNVIQLAIAPVFLLTAIGALIGVQTNRLARAVDRTRLLEEHQGQGAHDAMALVPGELKVLRSRMRLIYLAVALDVICALFGFATLRRRSLPCRRRTGPRGRASDFMRWRPP